MPSYIQKRRQRYYAILEIPRGLRPQFGGKPRFVRSLETESLPTARVRVKPLIEEWKADLARAKAAAGIVNRRTGTTDDAEFFRRALRTGAATTPAADDAAHFRRALRGATTQAEREAVLEHIGDAADAVGYLHAEVGQPASSSPEAREFYAHATGGHVSTLEHLDEWQTTCRTTEKTKDMAAADVKRFAVKFPLLRDVSRPAVRRWITALMNDDGLTPKTVQRILSALRGYWRFLQGDGIVPEADEPFAKLEVARQAKAKDKGAAELRQPFEPADVPKLVAGALARDDKELADLITLAMWTGCRIEELCMLKVADVNGDSFRVIAAKSAAGVRVVPVHAMLQPTLARLMKDSKDGYVLSSLTRNKYGDRSNGVGKRFGHMKTALGFGPALVFHSIRKSVATLLENAGVSEGAAADILGHEKQTITYGLYSGGATLEVKRAALAKLAYPI